MSGDGTEQWQTARKKPVEVEYRGPYTDPEVVETIEGDFEVDEEYIDEHGGYVIIRGVEGEVYPCALDIFEDTYLVHELESDRRVRCPDCDVIVQVLDLRSGEVIECPECHRVRYPDSEVWSGPMKVRPGTIGGAESSQRGDADAE
jgi:DNA-directed RNA polymerase subunit RPC12/RpoP